MTLAAFSRMFGFSDSPRPAAPPAPDPLGGEMALKNVSHIFRQLQECGEDPQRIHAAFHALQSATDQRSFLKFLNDDQIIAAGIAKSVPEIAHRWPELRL